MKRSTVLIGGLIFGLMIFSGFVFAQTKAPRRPATGGTSQVAYRHAWQFGYRAGYDDGYTNGKGDYSEDAPRDFAGSEDYNNADRTYKDSMGTLAEYQEGYRLGFELAYLDGYYGRPASTVIPANIGRIVIAKLNASGANAANTQNRAAAVPASGATGSRARPPAGEVRAGEAAAQSGGRTGGRNGVMVVPADVEMKIRLTSPINTRVSREGDRFTAVVLDPIDHADATIEGHIANLKRSGKATGKTELALAFDTIRWRDGRSGRLAAQVVRVYESETVKTIDEEGNVQSASRGKDTATRTAGGGAIGAIIGGIAGGAKGAVIGAVIGAGAGVGSVYIQGGKDLVLEPGTEILIRTAAPARNGVDEPR